MFPFQQSNSTLLFEHLKLSGCKRNPKLQVVSLGCCVDFLPYQAPAMHQVSGQTVKQLLLVLYNVDIGIEQLVIGCDSLHVCITVPNYFRGFCRQIKMGGESWTVVLDTLAIAKLIGAKKINWINFQIVIYILLLPLEIKYEGEDHIEKNDIRGISQDRFMKVAIDRKPK